LFQPLTSEQLIRAMIFFVSYASVLAQVIMSFFVDELPALAPHVSFLCICKHLKFKM